MAAAEKKGAEEAAQPVLQTKVVIQVDADRCRLSEILSLKELFRAHPGSCPLEIHFRSGEKKLAVVQVDKSWGVKGDAPFRDKLQALEPQSADMRTLTTLVEQRRGLVGDKTRITNRLNITLKEYFPQALDWFEDRDTRLFCDFLQRWPSLKHVKRARQATLRSSLSSRAPFMRRTIILYRMKGLGACSLCLSPALRKASFCCLRSMVSLKAMAC